MVAEFVEMAEEDLLCSVEDVDGLATFITIIECRLKRLMMFL